MQNLACLATHTSDLCGRNWSGGEGRFSFLDESSAGSARYIRTSFRDSLCCLSLSLDLSILFLLSLCGPTDYITRKFKGTEFQLECLILPRLASSLLHRLNPSRLLPNSLMSNKIHNVAVAGFGSGNDAVNLKLSLVISSPFFTESPFY